MELEPIPWFGVCDPEAKSALPKVYSVPAEASVAPETLTDTVVALLGSSLISTTPTWPSERRTPCTRSSELEEVAETIRSPGRAMVESKLTPYHGPIGVLLDEFS